MCESLYAQKFDKNESKTSKRNDNDELVTLFKASPDESRLEK